MTLFGTEYSNQQIEEWAMEMLDEMVKQTGSEED